MWKKWYDFNKCVDDAEIPTDDIDVCAVVLCDVTVQVPVQKYQNTDSLYVCICLVVMVMIAVTWRPVLPATYTKLLPNASIMMAHSLVTAMIWPNLSFKLTADGGSYCDDNNESDENPCSVDDGTNEVDQLCVNAQGSYVCAFGLRIRRK